MLQQLIAKTHFSISTDETRAHLNSALFEWDGDVVRMVTTDGHRLSKMEVEGLRASGVGDDAHPAEGHPGAAPHRDEAVAEAPAKDAEGRPRPQLQITQSGSSAFFQGGGTTFSVKLVDAQFPPYSQVIPQNSERKVRVPRARWPTPFAPCPSRRASAPAA